MEDVKLYRDTQFVLNEVFNQARQLYDEYLKETRKKELGKQEATRSWVPNRLVEFPHSRCTYNVLARISRSRSRRILDVP